MFERFTDRARRIIVLAQEEAFSLKHSYIGTEHLLLGLISEGDGVAARALQSFGLTTETLRATVIEIIGEDTRPSRVNLPFSMRAKKALELALRESVKLGHGYIGTEHVLLGLLAEGEGVGAQTLVKHGADLSRVKQQVINLLAEQVSPKAQANDTPGVLTQGLNEPERQRLAERSFGITLLDRSTAVPLSVDVASLLRKVIDDAATGELTIERLREALES